MTSKLKLIVVINFLLLGLFFSTTAQTSGDTFWHLAIGRRLFQEKSIPKTNTFVYGSEDKNFTSTEWLSGLIFYSFVKYFGEQGLIMLRLILALSTIYFLYLSVSLVSKNFLVKVLSLNLPAYILSLRLYDRPELFSFFLISFVNYLCLRYFFQNSLGLGFYLLPLIFLLWPNIHPFAVIGFTFLAFYLLFFLLLHLLFKKNKKGLLTFCGLIILSFLCISIQYKKTLIFLKASGFTDDVITELTSLPKRIMATGGYDFINQISLPIYFYLILVALYILLVVLLIKKNTEKSTFFLLNIFYLLILLLPFRLYRLIPLSVIATFPSLIFLGKIILKPSKTLNLALQTANGVIVALIVFSILSQYPIGFRENFRVTNARKGDSELRTPIHISYRSWLPEYPASSIAFIRENLETKKLFTSPLWNSYSIWQLPEVQTFSDAMFENRTTNDYQAERIIRRGDDGWQELLLKYNIDTVVNGQINANITILTPVYELPNWELVFSDEISAVYARGDVIRSKPLDLSAIHPELPELLKFKPEDETKALEQLRNLLVFDPRNGFARAQLIEFYFSKKDFTKVKELTEESRTIIPSNPWFSFYLSLFYLNESDCLKAINFGEEANRKSFSDYAINSELNKYLAVCGKKI